MGRAGRARSSRWALNAAEWRDWTLALFEPAASSIYHHLGSRCVNRYNSILLMVLSLIKVGTFNFFAAALVSGIKFQKSQFGILFIAFQWYFDPFFLQSKLRCCQGQQNSSLRFLFKFFLEEHLANLIICSCSWWLRNFYLATWVGHRLDLDARHLSSRVASLEWG